jgi:hypothetical protein
MIGFISPYTFTQLRTTDTALSLIYTLYSAPLHTHRDFQSSLVISWQRIYHSYRHFNIWSLLFVPPNSFLALILPLPIPNTLFLSIPLFRSSYLGRLASRISILHFRLDYSLYSTWSCLLTVSFITPRHRKHSLYCLHRECIYIYTRALCRLLFIYIASLPHSL